MLLVTVIVGTGRARLVGFRVGFSGQNPSLGILRLLGFGPFWASGFLPRNTQDARSTGRFSGEEEEEEEEEEQDSKFFQELDRKNFWREIQISLG